MGSEQTSPAAASEAAASEAISGSGGNKEHPAGTKAAEGAAALDALTSFQIECLKNARYHEDREIFFARLHKLTMLVAVLGGTATFAFVSQFKLFAGLIAIAGIVDLVFDVSGKARLHAALRRRVYDVMAQAENANRDLSELKEQAARIYADEPPCMHAVNALAYNAAMQAFDRPVKYQFPVTGWHRALRHWWPFTADDFKTHDEIAKARSA
ncbi:MAG: hypothetical protein AB7F72_04935 [Afipia sp.]